MKGKFTYKTVCFLLISAFFGGCSCKEAYMKEVSVTVPNDPELSCRQLAYRITEAKIMLRETRRRCAEPELYTVYPPCMLLVAQDAAKNNNVLSDRIEYLKKMYALKNCHRERDYIPKKREELPVVATLPTTESLNR